MNVPAVAYTAVALRAAAAAVVLHTKSLKHSFLPRTRPILHTTFPLLLLLLLLTLPLPLQAP
jgi:hypothetical protein